MKKIVFILTLLTAGIANADVSYQLEQLVGWTIVEVKTIEGHQEPDRPKQSGFEGCNGDTIIFFMDGTVAQCMSLGLQLSLMPKAVIFGTKTTYKGKEMILYKMLVEDNLYDIFFIKCV